MSKVLKISDGDYRIQATNNGKIVLDTPQVIVTGNIDVLGNSSIINFSSLSIVDNIITLNNQETNVGIGPLANYQSGVSIDRGTLPFAQILFDEKIPWYSSKLSSNTFGSFVLDTADGVLSSLKVATITNDGADDLVFDLQNGTIGLFIANSINYENQVVDDNHIPNKKYVDLAVSSGVASAALSSIQYPLTGTPNSQVRTTSSSTDFNVNSMTQGQFTATTFYVHSDNMSVSGTALFSSPVNVTATITTPSIVGSSTSATISSFVVDGGTF